MQEKKAPKLRFEDFNQDWEQRKFDNLVVRVNKSTNSNTLPKIEFEDILAGEGRLNKGVSQKFDDRKGVEFLPNDILFGKLRPYLKNWIKPSFTGVALGDFWVFRAIESDSDFIYSLIQANKYQRVANDTSGTKMPRSDWKKVSETEFFVPNNRKEQQKIGAFFKQLDDTIALHQRKIEQLKLLKQAFLQKMFVNHGSTPEMRFANFEEDWEQRKLEKLTEFFSGLTYSPENVQNDGTFVLRSSNVKNNAIISADNVYVSTEVANSEQVQVGDVIVVVRNGSRSLIGKHASIKHEMPNTVIGAFMTGLRSPSPKFLNALLDTQQFNVEIQKNLGATINQITTGEFKKMQFTVSIDEEEKEKIGSFFQQLDDTIILHQKKLKQIKQLKQAFLQKMFI